MIIWTGAHRRTSLKKQNKNEYQTVQIACKMSQIGIQENSAFSSKRVPVPFCSREKMSAYQKKMRKARQQSRCPFRQVSQKKLTDPILRSFQRKYLPGRNKIVAISVLACTDKGGESMSRIHGEERLQLHNAPKNLRGATLLVYYSTVSRHQVRSGDKFHTQQAA